ncbi:MAG: hypothetical protein AB2L18_07185 [Anaerolineaceae bacterium]
MKNIEKPAQESIFPLIPDEAPLIQKKSSKWLQILVIIGLVYGLGISILGAAANPSTENLTILMAIIFSGCYSLLLFLSRKFWISSISGENAHRNTAIFAIANAFFISFMVDLSAQLIQSSTAGESTISSSNYLVTIPWLIGIILLFIPVQKKYRFSWSILLLLSGLYEFISEIWLDGLLIPFLSGQTISFWYTFSDLLIFGFWQFAILYSPIFLVIGWIFGDLLVSEEEKKTPLLYALKPLVWILPFTIYFLIFYLIIG